MINASFYMANQLYGLSFHEITGTVPVFEPNVRVWEVTDRDGSYLGLFYGDYFARAGKRSGAWMNTYQSHETFTGRAITPIASNNNNFVRGAAGEPVLISLDDAQTLFHEFGHAIHYLVSTVNYPGLGNTPRDYVEYPSQVHEHWVLTRPILDQFARHYQTGAADAAGAGRPRQQRRHLQPGLRHRGVSLLGAGRHGDAQSRRRRSPMSTRSSARRWPPSACRAKSAMRHRLPQFGHLFSSDAYSAGYYSYLWSEVMDADTWEMFEASGNVFDPDRRRRHAQHHPRPRQHHRPRRSLPPIPRPRPGRQRAAARARLPGRGRGRELVLVFSPCGRRWLDAVRVETDEG